MTSRYVAISAAALILLLISIFAASPIEVRAAKPAVLLMAPFNITATKADIRAVVNPGTRLTNWWISITPPQEGVRTICNGVLQPVNAPLGVGPCVASNLRPSTTYLAVVGAENVDGNAHEARQFTTLAAQSPPDVNTLPPADVTATSAHVRASVNPKGKPTTWRITGGLYAAGQDHVVCPDAALPAGFDWVNVGCTWSNLSPSTEYQYLASADNSVGYGSSHYVDFWTLAAQPPPPPPAAAAAIDWAVLSVSTAPAAPMVGDSVIFRMTLSAVSSNLAFPRTVQVQCQLDGAYCGSGPVAYEGPTGSIMTVSSTTAWVATFGPHTLTWSVSTANDPNPNNNAKSTNFNTGAQAQTTVQTATTETTGAAQTTTQTLGSTAALSSTTVPTQTANQPTVQTVTQTVRQANPIDESLQMIQQNGLTIISLLFAIVIMLLIVALRRRRKTPAQHYPRPVEPTQASTKYCGSCGVPLKLGKAFCGSCGQPIE